MNFDFGQMKIHEMNAAKGDLFTSGREEFEHAEDDDMRKDGKVRDLALPVLVLIVSSVSAMIYTGYLDGATNVIDAFAGCNAEVSLIFSTFVTVIFMLFLYLPRKVITFKEFMGCFVEGFRLMIPAISILIFAWTLKGIGDALGIAAFVGGLVDANASANVVHSGDHVCDRDLPGIFNRYFLGNFCNSGSDRNCNVQPWRRSGNDDHFCICCIGRSSLRRPRISDFRYDGYVISRSTE